MSENKHTPGPWEWVTDGQRGEYFDGALRGQFGEAGAIYPILNVRLGEIEAAVVAVHEANARLIAAAPEMLEALAADAMDAHDALARLPSTEWVGHAETRDIMALIGKLRERLVAIAKRSDTAIRKATGGEQ